MKKVLSIVLSIVMVLCMMPAMAFAGTADFTDAADIEYVEAVEVLRAAGIIDGQPDGSFEPNGNVTREQAAKLIATVLLGDKAEKLATDVAPFADVAADRWSAGYIAYGVEKGILAGVGDNKFDPTGDVTALQLAKMLLVVMDYDATIEGLTGDKWGVNTSALAAEIELFKGNDAVLENKAATREEAALYILNTLVADMAYYTDKGTNVTLPDGTTIVSGASPVTVKANAAETETIVDDNVMQVAEKYVGKLVLSVEPDAFGRPADVWTYDAKAVGTYATKTPVVTYTTAVKEKDIYTALGAPGISGVYAKYVTIDKIYVDGVDETENTDYANTLTIAKGDESYVAGCGEGVKVEIYKNSTNHYTMVAIREYLGEVTDVIKAVDATEEARQIKVKVPGVVETTFETEAFAKEDDVIVTIAKGVIKSVEAVKKVENVAVTAYSNDSVTAGGTTYKYSQMNVVSDKTYTMKDTTYTLWLDSYDNIVKVETYSEASTDYVMILKSAADQGNDVVGTYADVKYVGLDGVAVAAKTKGDVPTNSTWYTVKDDEKNPGYVTFTAVASEKLVTKKNVTTAIAKTQPKLADGIVADANTTFVLKTSNNPETWKVYTGIANIPGYASGTFTFRAIKGADGYADVVYINVASATPSSSQADELVYIFNASAKSTAYDATNKVDYLVYDAIVNGTKTTINVADTTTPVINASKTGLVKVKQYDANGYVCSVEAVTDGGVYELVGTIAAAKYSAPTLTFVNDYLTDDATVVYMIDGTTVTAVKAADLADEAGSAAYVVYKATDNKTVKEIYFVEA